jgi:hypothetical protein
MATRALVYPRHYHHPTTRWRSAPTCSFASVNAEVSFKDIWSTAAYVRTTVKIIALQFTP